MLTLANQLLINCKAHKGQHSSGFHPSRVAKAGHVLVTRGPGRQASRVQ